MTIKANKAIAGTIKINNERDRIFFIWKRQDFKSWNVWPWLSGQKKMMKIFTSFTLYFTSTFTSVIKIFSLQGFCLLENKLIHPENEKLISSVHQNLWTGQELFP